MIRCCLFRLIYEMQQHGTNVANVDGQGLCERHVDQMLRYTERDKTPETANDVCCASAFHLKYAIAISPAPFPVGMPDNNNNASPDGTASTNTHSNVETSSREGSETTLMRVEAVVADRQSVSAEGIILRQDGGEQPESASVATKPGPSPSHGDTEQSIPRCRYNEKENCKIINYFCVISFSNECGRDELYAHSTVELTKSNIRLTDSQERTWREKSKRVLKDIKYCIREITVEPCLFTFMLCTALSSLAVQNMHLEKSCRVNLQYSDEICDRIRDRNTTGLEKELNNVQSSVAKVVAWKFPLQTAIPAIMVLFIGAWSDKTKKRKICILFPFTGEIIANIGLLFATYYFNELSLTATALIEALPAAFTGSYIIIFMGMYSFMADRTTIENRTFRLGVVTICVSLGTPTGTALSGILLRVLGYYGENYNAISDYSGNNKFKEKLKEIFKLVAETAMVAVRPRAFGLRTQIFSVILLYIIMVGPLYGDSQVSYLYAIRKFNLSEVEFSIYGAINTILGLIGTFFCITVLSKKLDVQDSIIGVLAGVSRIAACMVFAFAPNRECHTALTAVRTIATKSVPTEEVAKLSSLMGVTEAIAPSIYMPTSSFIYVSTIETFPGAFYMFDAALTVFALGLFTLIYILVKRRKEVTVTNPGRKEEFARTNEVSNF
ncbi:unnamed protein product [Parnassius apollo]|uniref:(apollo) hypothetical protein n=1 Tax=Parnassius apollo TaxID=110799 RepID=A0A8S3Y407_PARAO|nr:unnamed protein product [Parnassius apollo]